MTTSDAEGGRGRRATHDDVDRIASIITDAFLDDPCWGWAFPDQSRRHQQQGWLWRSMALGALRYPWVWITENEAAVSVWIPPDGTELSAEQEATVEPTLRHMLGDGADRALRTLELFDENHPHDEPHHYLSLLAVDPAQRGRGLGLGLLQDNLRVLDRSGGAAYLEASNPANVPLYQRYGFVVRGSFTLPEGGPEVVTMWRDGLAGGASQRV